MANVVVRDMQSRDFWVGLVVAICTFLLTYHLPRIINRNG